MPAHDGFQFFQRLTFCFLYFQPYEQEAQEADHGVKIKCIVFELFKQNGEGKDKNEISGHRQITAIEVAAPRTLLGNISEINTQVTGASDTA